MADGTHLTWLLSTDVAAKLNTTGGKDRITSEDIKDFFGPRTAQGMIEVRELFRRLEMKDPPPSVQMKINMARSIFTVLAAKLELPSERVKRDSCVK